MADFRSERMPSPEGRGAARGRARQVWDAYTRMVEPLVAPLTVPLARGATFDALGFYMVWHLHGGFEGLQRDFGMSRSAVYRRVALFRKAFGVHPDEFVLPGVSFDVEAYWAPARKPEAAKPS